MKKIFIFLIVVACALSYSCKNEGSKHKIEKQDMNGPEYTSKYICPMHCKGSGSENPGVCPVCQMDYELRE